MTFVIWLIALQLPLAQSDAQPTATKSLASEKARDAAVEESLRRFDEASLLKEDDSYFYNSVDLNGDGEPEALVYLHATGYCRSSGCPLLVMKKHGDRYETISTIGNSRMPVVVSSNRTNGWNDLVVWNEEYFEDPSHYSIVQFNGKSYPVDKRKLDQAIDGVAYLDNPVEATFGVTLGR